MKVEAPLVTVAMPDSSYVVDDYYAAHPLMELPPEEEPMVDVTAPAPPKPFKESIHMCRSVNKYKKLERLNEGSYGIVYKAQNMETGEIVALKRVRASVSLLIVDQVQRYCDGAGGVSCNGASRDQQSFLLLRVISSSPGPAPS